MKEKKQVAKAHYEFNSYMKKTRWNSLWHQLDEVIKLHPKNVLEIGHGSGTFKEVATLFGLKVETLDIDSDLQPDFVGSVTSLPFTDNCYDVVCAFQVLEHLPYTNALCAFRELSRVCRNYIVISLPDAKIMWRYHFHIPKIGKLDTLIPRPFLRARPHIFDGQHYWEINKKGYPLIRIVQDFSVGGMQLLKTYRVHENPYHRFFVFRKY